MATRIKLVITVIAVISAITHSLAQTSDVKDVQVAKVKLQIGTNAAKYLSSLAETISGAATHNQSPTAKAVYDYIQSLNIITTGTTAAGDLDGTYPSPTVDGIQNRPVLSTAPSSGEVLKWNGTAWAPSASADGNGIYGGSGTTGAAFTAVNVDSIIRFNTTDPNGRFIANVSGGSDVAGLLIADTLSQLSYDDAGGTNLVEVNNEGISLTTLTSDRVTITGSDTRYAADYSAGFSARSLVDKAYVDGALSGEVSIPDGEIAYGNATSDGITSSPTLTYDGDLLTNDLISLEGSSGTITGKDATLQDLGASSSTSGGTVTVANFDNAALTSGHRMGLYQFSGNTGIGSTGIGASIQGFAGATWTGTSSPGELRFNTTPSGTLTEKERFRLTRSATAQLRNGTALDFLNTSDAEVIEFSVADSAMYIYGLGGASEGEVVFQTKIGLFYLYSVALTGNKDNMFIGGGNIIEVGSDGAYNITGAIGGMRQGGSRLIFTKNVSNFVLTIKDESASSTAANRFDLGGTDYEWQPNEMLIWVYFDADDRWNILNKSGGTPGATDHGALTGLTDDDHTQYAMLDGRSGGQILTGGTGAGDDLTLRSTSNATKGDIFAADQGGNVVVGGAATASELRFMEPSGSGTNYTGLKAGSSDASTTYTLPVVAPANTGLVLTSTTGGALSWVMPSTTIRPAQITATQNDYNPTGYSTTTTQYMEVTGDSLFRTITGLKAATRDGVTKTFANTARFCYILAKEHTGSSAANRFKIPKDIVMFPGMEATLRYDSVNAYWRLVSSNEANTVFGNVVKSTLRNNTSTATSGDGTEYTFTANGGTVSQAGASGTTNRLRTILVQSNSAATTFPTVHTKSSVIFLAANVSYIRAFCRIRTDATLSDATNDYDIRLQIKANSDTTISEGAYINYQRELNSGGWQLVTHDGSTPNNVNAGSPIVANTYYNLELIYYPYGEVTAFINGARYTTTSNLPTLLASQISIQVDRDNGTASRGINLEAFDVEVMNVSD